MLIHWTFDPIAVQAGPLVVRWYGLLFVGAFVVGQRVLARMFRAEGVRPELAESLFLYALVGAVAGARLVHCLAYEPAFYLAHPLAILKLWEGGLASHGGVIGVVAGLAIASRRARPSVPFVWLADRVAIPAAFAAFAIRLGNFLNSEIVGVPTSGGWGVVFTAVDAVPRHPVQLYEAVAYLGIAVLLSVLYRRGAGRRSGYLLGWLLVLVFSARIALEFFKVPQASYEQALAFSVGQSLSVPFVLAGLALVLRALKNAGAPARPVPHRGG